MIFNLNEVSEIIREFMNDEGAWAEAIRQWDDSDRSWAVIVEFESPPEYAPEEKPEEFLEELCGYLEEKGYSEVVYEQLRHESEAFWSVKIIGSNRDNNSKSIKIPSMAYDDETVDLLSSFSTLNSRYLVALRGFALHLQEYTPDTIYKSYINAAAPVQEAILDFINFMNTEFDADFKD